MSKSKSKVVTEPKLLLDRIHLEFPDLTWKSYNSVLDGWDHEVIILDDAIVFRFPNDYEYTTALATEINVLRQLQPLLKANIPNYSYVSSDGSFAGYPIVPGEIISKNVFKTLNNDAVISIAKQLANLLSSIHAAKSEGIDLRGVKDSYMPDEQMEVKKLAKKYLSTLLSADDYEVVQSILSEVDRLLKQSTPTSFIHGDVYSNHLLWDSDNQKLGLIDFSDMTIADPAIDFAELYEYGTSFVEKVYDNYTGVKDSSFLNRAWIYQRWTGVYMMTDHFVYRKTSFEVAKETFDRVKAIKA